MSGSTAGTLDVARSFDPFRYRVITIRLKRSKHLTQTITPSRRSLILDRLLDAASSISDSSWDCIS